MLSLHRATSCFRVLIGLGVLLGLPALAGAFGLDSNASVAQLAEWQRAGRFPQPLWFRVRSLPEPGVPGAGPAIADAKRALAELQAAGHRVCVVLRWEGSAQAGALASRETEGFVPGVRQGREFGTKGGYLPLDLRHAYRRARDLERTYGEFVAAWEVDNEPDLRFVPENAENYAAFLKASYLGFQAGRRSNPAQSAASLPSAKVVMAPLGLPPGPWFERFVANEGLGYTEAFNFHFYGYVEDLSGVYRCFEAAVEQAGAAWVEGGVTREWPVFATEIGYGMLGVSERESKSARVRQWSWFNRVGDLTDRLGIEAPIAFYLPPYSEPNGIEFGLSVARTRPKDFSLYASGGWYAGKNFFRPADFGGSTPEPWMKQIGAAFGSHQATPALAAWLTRPRQHPVRSWSVRTPPASPVVIDLVAGEGVYAEHRYNGHFLRRQGEDATGWVDLVLYNFSDRPLRGTLALPKLFRSGAENAALELQPLERRVVRAQVVVGHAELVAHPAEVVFRPDDRAVAPARMVTAFLAQAEGRRSTVMQLLDRRAAESSPYLPLLRSRELAEGEDPKRLEAGCLVQEGTSVQWSDNALHVTVTSRSPSRPRRVEVEIPLPAGWEFRSGEWLRTSFRARALGPRESRLPAHDECFVQVRAANGNLFGVPPARRLAENPQWFWEPVENFSLWFYGRAQPPWRFRENQPVALVLVLFPVSLPARYEFDLPALVRLEPAR